MHYLNSQNQALLYLAVSRVGSISAHTAGEKKEESSCSGTEKLGSKEENLAGPLKSAEPKIWRKMKEMCKAELPSSPPTHAFEMRFSTPLSNVFSFLVILLPNDDIRHRRESTPEFSSTFVFVHFFLLCAGGKAGFEDTIDFTAPLIELDAGVHTVFPRPGPDSNPGHIAKHGPFLLSLSSFLLSQLLCLRNDSSSSSSISKLSLRPFSTERYELVPEYKRKDGKASKIDSRKTPAGSEGHRLVRLPWNSAPGNE